MISGARALARTVRLSTLLLVLVLFSVVGGVYVATSELNAADEAHARGEAQLAIASVQSLVVDRENRLAPLAHLAGDSLLPVAILERVGETLVSRRDTSGRGPGAFEWIGLCPVRALTLADLPRSKCTRLAGAEDAILLSRSLLVQLPAGETPTPSHYVVGLVSHRSFDERLQKIVDYRTRRVLLMAGPDTVGQAGETTRSRRYRTERATLRSADIVPADWMAEIDLAPGGAAVRWAVLLVALGSIAGLTLAVRWERRETRRATERAIELQAISDEMLRSNRVKNEFLANVSHELRTPLNAIVGFTELLREGVYGELNARQKSPVERIEVSANHLRRLVDQILDLAKIAAGRLDVHRETIDLRSFILDIVTEVEPLVQERQLSLSIGVGATLPRLQSDPNHLRQILMNLLGNAIKFTERGTISVRARLVGEGAERPSRGRPSPAAGVDQQRLLAIAPKAAGVRTWVAVQVTDSGRGIAPRDLERIFDEFEQVNAGARSDAMRQGTGLGLTISRRLARLIGGDLSVESVLGTGSTFTLWLPVTEP